MRQRRIAVMVMAVSAAVVATLGGCGSDDEVAPLPQNTLPAGITNVVGPNVYDGATDDLLTAGLGKTGIGGAAPGFADAANPTAAELRRRAIYVNYRGVIDPTVGWRIRPAVRAEHRPQRRRHARRGQDPRPRVPRLRRRRQRAQERHGDGAGPEQLRSQQPVHRRRPVVRFARRLRRDRHGRRLGPEAPVRRGVHRRRQGHRLPRPDVGQGQPDRRTARVARERGGQPGALRRRPRRRAVDLQRAVPEPHRLQAHLLAAESGEGLGQERPRQRPLRVLGDQPALRRPRLLGAGR